MLRTVLSSGNGAFGTLKQCVAKLTLPSLGNRGRSTIVLDCFSATVQFAAKLRFRALGFEMPAARNHTKSRQGLISVTPHRTVRIERMLPTQVSPPDNFVDLVRAFDVPGQTCRLRCLRGILDPREVSDAADALAMSDIHPKCPNDFEIVSFSTA